MPFLNIHTSKAIGSWLAKEFLKSASVLVVEHLGKPESVMMTALQQPQSMTLGGTDDSAAMIELSVLALDDEKVPALYEALHALAMKGLGLPGDRIFITFLDVPRSRWGWNGERF